MGKASRRKSAPKTETMSATVVAVCPFCPDKKSISTNEAKMALFHDAPPCREFVENDVLEFLRMVRRKIFSHYPERFHLHLDECGLCMERAGPGCPTGYEILMNEPSEN
jgi:hypothetical protein